MSPSGPPDDGAAGSSARREFERRRENRERRTREAHPCLGGLLLRLHEPPAHETAWLRGAEGEERLAASLARRCDEGVLLLHDRRIPGRRANIDHVAVAPSGVWVIDAKRYRGKVRVSAPLFGKVKLRVGGREKSKLIEGLDRQVATVRAVVEELAPSTPVMGALCFVDGDLPLLRTLRFEGYPMLYPRRLARRLNAPGPLGDDARAAIAAGLAARLPAA